MLYRNGPGAEFSRQLKLCLEKRELKLNEEKTVRWFTQNVSLLKGKQSPADYGNDAKRAHGEPQKLLRRQAAGGEVQAETLYGDSRDAGVKRYSTRGSAFLKLRQP